MKDQIMFAEIKNNPLFWYTYISLFRGYDEGNEISIEGALDVIDVNKDELFKWQKGFFVDYNSKEIERFIGGRLSDILTFNIEFHENEIVYFLNDIYIGNLGGHFEAWFLTLDELIKFGSHDLLFLLLLPLTGIEKGQFELAKSIVIEHVRLIKRFENNAEHIAICIVNGLLMEEGFKSSGIGITNNQNHSVRNIEKYPRYREKVRELNLALKIFNTKT